MSNWLNYKGIDVPNAPPADDAGVKLKNDLMQLADRYGPIEATVVATGSLPSNNYLNGADGVGATLTATSVGALIVDSYSVQVGETVVVNNEGTPANNGLYVVTAPGDGSHSYVLTRHSSLDTAAQLAAGAIVQVGNTGATIRNTILSCQPVSPITVGTTDIVFGWSENGGNVTGPFAHAEGRHTTASGEFSHAEGYFTTSSGYYSHAEGQFNTASGGYSHAEGYFTSASGYGSHAEGSFYTTASSYFSHAEGFQTSASGYYSHAEGTFATASGDGSHAGGISSLASLRGQWARSGSSFSEAGDAQESSIVLLARADSTTPIELTLDGEAINVGVNTFDIPSNTTIGFEIAVTGRRSGGANWGTFRFTGTVTNNSGTLTLAGAGSPWSSEGSNSGAVPASWSVAIGILGTRLTITATGTAENIGWVGRVKAVHDGYN